jgi:transcription antitermination factor NusA-like protein
LLVNALSPIEIRKIDVNEDNSLSPLSFDDESYPAVLGKRGMNARLNGELIGAELQVQKMKRLPTDRCNPASTAGFSRRSYTRSKTASRRHELPSLPQA